MSGVMKDGRQITAKELGNRGGRPKKTMLEHHNIKEKRALLKFEQYLEKAVGDIKALQIMSKNPDITAAQVSARKTSLSGLLALINKCVPDLRSTEISGAVAVGHMHAPVSTMEMATRIQLWQKEVQELKVINEVPAIPTNLAIREISEVPGMVIPVATIDEKVASEQLVDELIYDWL